MVALLRLCSAAAPMVCVIDDALHQDALRCVSTGRGVGWGVAERVMQSITSTSSHGSKSLEANQFTRFFSREYQRYVFCVCKNRVQNALLDSYCFRLILGCIAITLWARSTPYCFRLIFVSSDHTPGLSRFLLFLPDLCLIRPSHRACLRSAGT